MDKTYRILVINPGSTSTKLSMFENETCLFTEDVFHDSSVLKQFPTINDQLDYRMEVVDKFLKDGNIDLTGVDAIVGRGGGCYSVEGGIYKIDDRLIQDTKAAKGGLYHSSMLGVQMADVLHKKYGGIMIHSSAVEVDGKAYLFSAPCGTGKSTHTKQWQKYFGADQAIIINDDKPVLRRLEDGWYAYGTPFSGKTDENVNKKVKLQGICMLERGENRIRQIQPAEAIPLILQQTIRPKNEKYLGKMMEIMDQLLREVPVYRMQCDISEEAVKMSYEAMKG